MSTATEQREVVSPEGVEERLVEETTFRITLTGGGKYRCYHGSDSKLTSVGVHDTIEEAQKSCASGMIMVGGLTLHPEKVIDAIFRNRGPK